MTDATDDTRVSTDTRTLESTQGDDDATSVYANRPSLQATADPDDTTRVSATAATVKLVGDNAPTRLDESRRTADNSISERAATGTEVLANRYELIEEIGRGGTATVYKAIDHWKQQGGESGLIAVKVMHGRFDQIGAESPLIQEVARSQGVSHPNIVRVYDVAMDGDQIFMTMELLEGETLQQRLHRQERIPIPELDGILKATCAGLAECHRLQIVHSDVKPANIFITYRDEIRVLDLGIARVLGAQARFSGYTELYAAPEQMAGANPTPGDDVYAIACTAFECATGRHPFERLPANQAKAKGLVPQFDKTLPRRYRRALGRGLSFDPAKRPRDAAEFWKLLDPARVIRRRVAVAAGVSVILAIGMSDMYVSWSTWDQIQVSSANRDKAKAHFAKAQELLASSPEQGREELIEALKDNPYHDAAAATLAAEIRTLFAAGDVYGEGNDLMSDALILAPKSTTIAKVAQERIDQLLDHFDPAKLTPSDRPTAENLCKLQTDYRSDEVAQFERAANVACEIEKTLVGAPPR